MKEGRDDGGVKGMWGEEVMAVSSAHEKMKESIQQGEGKVTIWK